MHAHARSRSSDAGMASRKIVASWRHETPDCEEVSFEIADFWRHGKGLDVISEEVLSEIDALRRHGKQSETLFEEVLGETATF